MSNGIVLPRHRKMLEAQGYKAQPTGGVNSAPASLDADELNFLQLYAEGQFLTYAAHAAGAGLFPAEEKRMAWLDQLSKKLAALAAIPSPQGVDHD